MAENTRISWCDHSFNPWLGCERVSAGCQHCYAEQWAKRSGLVEWGRNADRRVTSDATWRKPLKWDRDAAEAGRPAFVFCASLADVFEDRDELVDPRERLFDLIDATPNLVWLLLTKRPENVLRMVPGCWGDDFEATQSGDEDSAAAWPSNVWIGTTIEDQAAADKRLPILAEIPATRFLSCEPLLGPVDLSLGCEEVAAEWVIVGGESGPGHRPMEADWVRSIRDQCTNADVPLWFKQWGGARPGGEALIDGVEWRQRPNPSGAED